MVKRWVVMALLFAVGLVACGCSAGSRSAPVATSSSAGAAARSGGDTVVASGHIVPAQRADGAFTVSGRVQTVAVARGDQVQPGDVLVTLETDRLQANVAQAEAALAGAQAQLALLEAGPRPEEIAAAKAQVKAARGALAQAEAQRDQSGVGATRAEVAAAQAQVAATMADQVTASEIHNQTMTCVPVDLPGGETRTICPALGPMEEQARYNLHAADLAQAAAQAKLNALLAGADAEVRAADAAVLAASAQRDVAQAQLVTLQAGASPEEIAVAEATVGQADAALQVVRAALDQATLRAPFSGTVTSLEINPGETVLPAQVVLTLADLRHLQVQTTDLSELDVAQVSVGQQATAYVDALDAEVKGRVVRIASQANTVGGDEAYAVTIELDEQLPGLRWGMSADVEIAPE